MNRWKGLNRQVFCFAIALVCTRISVVFARQDVVPGSRYTSARAAAMGDAFLPIGEDGGSALFYNPAILGRIQGMHVEPLNLSLYTNTGYIDTFSLRKVKFYKMPSLSGYAPVLQENQGTFAGVGASLLPAHYMKGFAVGALMQTRLAAVANEDGSIRYQSLYQVIPAIGFGFRLAGGILRFGYSLQWVNEAAGDLTVPDGTDPMGYNQGLAQGSAMSHNLGFALTLPISYLPAFNLVARNVLGARYSNFMLIPLARNPASVPETEPMTIDASVSIQPKLARGVYMNLVLQYSDATNVSGVPVFGRTALGGELSFRDSLFLRGGWGRGYPHAGVGFRRKNGEISFTWYSEDVGGGYHVQQDTRYMMQYQIRAF